MTKNSLNHIDSEAVKIQLKKILQSDKFLSSSRFTRFLEYIVLLSISGNSDKIKEYNIGVDVFDRGENFVAQLDPIVRVYAGRLRQALNDYYHSDGKDDSVKIEIPKGTYVPEFTLNKNNLDEPFKPQRVQTKHRFLNKTNIVLANVALIAFLTLLYFISSGTKDTFQEDVLGRTSIEIVPFKNLNRDTENNHFILKLIDQTEIALGQFSSVLINTESDIREAKSSSNYTMSGTMQQEKDIIKIRVKLVDNRSGILVFSKDYNESLNTNAAAYLEEVFANKIAVDLADEFGELQNLRLRNAQNDESGLLPHEAVLLYYDYLTHMNKSDCNKVLLELQKTVKKYGQYEPAWAAMSGLYMDKYRHFGGDLQDVVLAKEAIKKAEIINPRSMHVQIHLAQIAFSDKNIDDFNVAIEKQIELNPNSTMLGQVGFWLCLIGDYARGLPLIEQAKQRNSYYPGYIHFGNYFYFLEKGDFENAYSEVEKVNMPLLFWDPLIRAATLGHLGRIEEGKLALKDLLLLKPDFSMNGNEIMNRSLYLKKHQKSIVEGLEKIGFAMNKDIN